MTIRKSQWGFTAYHPSGRAVAHSHSRALLEAYVRDAW